MPTYDYRCTSCGSSFEATHGMGADGPACPQCRGPAQKVFLSAPAVHGYMARGRDLAVRTLEPKSSGTAHGPGCPCCH